MILDAPHLIWNFIFGGVGFVYFQYGRKQGVLQLVIAGLVLMAYGYFFDSLAWLIGLGIVFTAAPWVAR